MALQQVRRGRPSAPTTIVDEITTEKQVLQENWRLLDLGSSIRQPLAALQWLAQRRLIKNSVFCNNCQIQYTLNSYKDATDGYRWKCKGCKERRSVRQLLF